MNKPNAVTQLLEELKGEITDSAVGTGHGSQLKIILPNGSEFVFNVEECELVLYSSDTVAQLFEALGSPADCGVELHNIRLEDEVQDALERTFSTVDEV